MRRVLLTVLGLAIAAAYVLILALVASDQGAATVRRGVILAVVTGAYGWCFGKERWMSTRRLVVDQVCMPLVLLSAALAGIVFLFGYAITWTASLFTGRPAPRVN